MGHALEPAASGRAKCRACGDKIEKGRLRFGERLPNPFADEGDATYWFHPECAAYRRPEPFLEVLDDDEVEAEHRASVPPELRLEAQRGVDQRRLPRLAGAERASSGRASCRSCKESIAKDSWRLRIAFWDEGMFRPGGFVHASCARDYCEGEVDLARIRRFSPELGDEGAADLGEALAT